MFWNWIWRRNSHRKDVDGAGVSEHPPRLLASRSRATTQAAKHFQISQFSAVSSLRDNLLLIPLSRLVLPAYFLKSILSQSIKFMQHVCLQLPSHPVYFHPRFNYFLVSAETHSILYCSLMRVATPKIYVGAEGWLSNFLHRWQCRWHCVCFKSSRQMCIKDVWTTQPCNSSRHWPFLSHLAISLCITVICHVSSFGLSV